MTTEQSPICGAIKLVPIGFIPMVGKSAGAKYVAMACVRKPDHPERDADVSLHLCGETAWKVGPGDDYRQTDEYKGTKP